MQKAALYGLWPYGFVALWPWVYLLLLLITQRHYSHPGSTGSMQAAKVSKFAYRLDFISASYAAAYHLHKLFKRLLRDMLLSVIPKVIPYWCHAFDDAYRLFYHTNCKQRAQRTVRNYYILGTAQ